MASLIAAATVSSEDGSDSSASKGEKAAPYDPSSEGGDLLPYPFFYYRDFSRVTDPDPSSKTLNSLKGANNFPVKMHIILSDPELEDIVGWLPHGRSWRILRPREFERKVIPAYFEHTKFSSFIRQANGWGFRRVIQGRDRGSYYHEKFLRGMPHLCKKMKRPGKAMKITIDTDHEPDLYKIAEMFPVPESQGNEENGGSDSPGIPKEVVATKPDESVEDAAVTMPTAGSAFTRPQVPNAVSAGEASVQNVNDLGRELLLAVLRACQNNTAQHLNAAPAPVAFPVPTSGPSLVAAAREQLTKEMLLTLLANHPGSFQQAPAVSLPPSLVGSVPFAANPVARNTQTTDVAQGLRRVLEGLAAARSVGGGDVSSSLSALLRR